MKKFKDFIINEEVDLTAGVEGGKVDVHDHAVRNNINAFLNGELACNVVTPYVALNKANKVLANFHIFLPKAPYMEDDHGVHVFKLKQFGKVAGMRNDGTVVTKVEQPYSLYFEWKRNERGMFDVFAEIVTDEELADLLDAVEEDVSEDQLDEEFEIGKVHHHEHSNGEISYFIPQEKLKNGKHKGLQFDQGAAGRSGKKPKQYSYDNKHNFWSPTPEDKIPSHVKDHLTEDQLDEANFPGAPDVKKPRTDASENPYAKEYSRLHQELRTQTKREDKEKTIDDIQKLVDKHLPGNSVPSKKVWLDEEEKKTQGQMLADMAKKKRDEAKRKRKVLGLDEMKNPAKEGMIAAGYKGKTPAEQGMIAAKLDDEYMKKIKKKKLKKMLLVI